MFFLTYDINAVEEEVVKNDFFGFSAWWADVERWWSLQFSLFLAYLDWIAVIACVILILLYAVTHDKKMMQRVWIIVVIWICIKGVGMAV
jgi:hypothetical protein